MNIQSLGRGMANCAENGVEGVGWRCGQTHTDADMRRTELERQVILTGKLS